MFITIKGTQNEARFDVRRINGVERFTGKEYDGKARDEVQFPCLSVFTPEGKTGFRFDSEAQRDSIYEVVVSMMEEAVNEERHQKRQNANVDANVLHSMTFAQRFLTKREQFALEAMKVIMHTDDEIKSGRFCEDDWSADAFRMADAMLKAGSHQRDSNLVDVMHEISQRIAEK